MVKNARKNRSKLGHILLLTTWHLDDNNNEDDGNLMDANDTTFSSDFKQKLKKGKSNVVMFVGLQG